jgi:myo-inositol-1(or 4)-monophosphatase
MTDYAALLPIARAAVALGGRIVRDRAPTSVAEKSERDLVTDVDYAVEDAIRDFLARQTPDIAMVGEERGHSGPEADGRWWVLDPVDGTTNFARGIPLCGVSLGLVEAGRGVVAAIEAPYLGVSYAAAEGSGAWQDDRPMRAASVRTLSDAVISLGDFAVGAQAEQKNRLRIELLTRLGARAQRVRMIGTAALDLAWVASGQLDASIILANLPWDTMAGVLLVREAGGVVLDQDGTEHSVDAAATIAVCAGLRAEIMAVLRDAETAVAG